MTFRNCPKGNSKPTTPRSRSRGDPSHGRFIRIFKPAIPLDPKTTVSMLVPRAETDTPDTRTVIDVLAAAHSQTILETVTEPMTVNEISHVADIPLTSAYRRVTAIEDAGLLSGQIASTARKPNP